MSGMTEDFDPLEWQEKISKAPKLVFHQFSHLDDAATQWFLRHVAKVEAPFDFQPNNDLKIDGEAGEIGLDVIHQYAVKGYQEADGTFSSALRFVIEVFLPDTSDLRRKAVDPICKWVDGDDSTGSATKAILGAKHELLEKVGLTHLFSAYKTRYSTGGDELINSKYGEEVLSVLYDHQLAVEKVCEQVLQSCEFHLVGCVGVCLGVVPREASDFGQTVLRKMASEQNMQAPRIYLYRDPKMGIGMIRMVDDLRLDEQRLQDYLKQFNGDEWFFHPGGFMAACGSGTTPRDPDTIPVDAMALARELDRIYS